MGVFTDQVQVLGSEAKQARRRREQREKEQAILYNLETKLKNKFNIYLQDKKISIGDYTFQSDKREIIYLQLLNFDIKKTIIDSILLKVQNEKIDKNKLYNILDDKYFTILNKTKQPYLLMEKANIKYKKEQEKEAEKEQKELEKQQLEILKQEEIKRQNRKKAWQNLGLGILYTIALIFGILSGIIKGSRTVNTKRRF